MGFSESIRTCLTKYVVLSGRAERSEYWWFSLFAILVYVAAMLLKNVLPFGLGTYLYPATQLALFLPLWGAGVRRLHDTGRSGWWLLITLIPIVGSLLLPVWLVGGSTPGPNTFGPSSTVGFRVYPDAYAAYPDAHSGAYDGGYTHAPVEVTRPAYGTPPGYATPPAEVTRPIYGTPPGYSSPSAQSERPPAVSPDRGLGPQPGA
jgi:uncharacterized membrane protein YhaH (DUF805 family)